MANFLILACLVIGFHEILETRASTCQIEGLRKNPYQNYKLQIPIADTHRGIITSFPTKNIQRIKVVDSTYLNVTWSDQLLTFFVSDNFKNIEKETKYMESPVIKIEMQCTCTEDDAEKIIVEQSVIDTNNHAPVFSENRYDYVFGMSIPKNAELTDIFPIRATDYDFTNTKVTFDMEENEFFRLDVGQPTYYQSKEYATILTALKNITAPFKKEFVITATDNGQPIQKTKVFLTITVKTAEEIQDVKHNALKGSNEDVAPFAVHPPVFSKHLYFADYTIQHKFETEEPIVIKYGVDNSTKLKLRGYEKYFKVSFPEATRPVVAVEKLDALPSSMLKGHDFLTLQIEAENEGPRHIPGRTALLIRLPNLGLRGCNGMADGGSAKCAFLAKSGCFSDSPSILFLLSAVCIVFVNAFVVIVFVNRMKQLK